MIAEIWEGRDGWFARLIDEQTGLPAGTLFRARNRGSIIAQITMWVPLTHLPIRDCYNPMER